MPLTDPVLVFTVLIAVILIAPLVAEGLRMPDIVLLLLAGTLLGEHVFGVLERNDAIILFGNIGLLYIMFLAGLEIDLHHFAQSRWRTTAFGLMTFAIPMILGTAMGRFLLGFPWPAAVLLASLFASHTLLAYPIASRLRITRNQAVIVTVGATIITDVLALLVLAVVAERARGAALSWQFWTGLIVGIIALTSLAWWGIPCLARWFFNHVREKGGAQFLFVLTTVCACAYLSHFARLEPIIGAFLAGAAFNRLIPANSALMNRVQFAGNSLFIPFFLIKIGMMVDPVATLTDRRSIQVALAMIAGVIVTKWLATRIAAAWFGYRRDERAVMFGLSVVQAAATLAAVLVGKEVGIFDDTVLNGAIAMIIVTCPLGSWLVERHGRRLAASSAERMVAPAVEQRLLVSVANPESVESLLDLSFVLRDTDLPGSIHPVSFVHDSGETAVEVAQSESILAQCLTHAAAVEIPVTPSISLGLNLSDGLVRASKELRADLVLMDWGQERLTRHRLFGTLLENILEDCPARILLCRLPQPINTIKRMLLPLPPSADKRSDLLPLLGDAKRLARQLGATLHIALPQAVADLRGVIEEVKPSAPITLTISDTWHAALDELFAEMEDSDLALVPMERRESPLWTPSLDRLAQNLANRFPDHNLLACYPPLGRRDDSDAISILNQESGHLPLVLPLELQLDSRRIDRAVWCLTAVLSDLSGDQRRLLADQLTRSARSYPVELAPGIALIHAHSDGITASSALIGTSRVPWQLPGLQAPTHTLLALVSPGHHASRGHLKALQAITRCFLDPTFAEQAQATTEATALALQLGRQMRRVTSASHQRPPAAAERPDEEDTTA